MPKNRSASIAKKSTQQTKQSKWLKAATKSIGASTRNVFKDLSPNIYSAISAGTSTAKDVSKSIRSGSSSGGLKQNKYVKFAETAYKNAMQDLRTGNLNNEDRVNDVLMEESGFSDFDSFFDDTDMSFDESDVNINVNQDNGAMLAVANQIKTQTDTHLKTSKASLDAYISMSSAGMMQMQQIGSEIIGHLGSIDSNIQTIADSNEKMNTFMEKSLEFYERMGANFDKDSSYTTSDRVTASNVVSSSGGVDFSSYKQYITQNMQSAFKGSQVGFAASLIDDQMIKMAIANPLGFATEGLVRFMVPKMLTNTIKGVEETFTSFMPALLHKISLWGEEQATGMLGNMKQMFGKIFGLKVERTESIDKSTSIQKGPVPFDGITRHAITEVITKELREQTGYLKAIAEHYKIDTNKARNNADVFDYNTGKYTSVSDVTSNIIEEIRQATLNSMNNSEFGKELRKASLQGTNKSQQDAIDQMIDQLMLRFEKHGDFVNISDKSKDSDYSKIMSSLKGEKNIKTLLDNYIQDMIKNDSTKAMSLSNAVLNARTSRNRTVKDIETNASEYNLFAARDLDEKTLDELIFQMYENPNSAHFKNKKQKTTKIASQERRTEGISGALKNTGDKLKSAMSTAIFGSPQDAVKIIGSIFGDTFKSLYDSFNNNFISPLKTTIFGNKDDDGYSRNGIFSSLQNGLRDTMDTLKYHVTGKEFKDSKGNVHSAKEDGDSVVGNLKKIGSSIKDGVMEKLFGKKNLDKDGNETGQRERTGILSKFSNTIKDGLAGWQEALFGKKLDEEERKNLKASMIKNLNERMPSSFTGAAIGAGVGLMSGGSLLGFLVGGPIGGAALGLATGFAAKSEKFQNWLFGEKDEDGKRTGGLISKNVQNYFKKNKNAMIGGAAIGAVKGFMTGGGVLGGLVGGPIAGALMGTATAMIAKSDTFKEFLFGSEKTGQRGVVNIFKSVFSSNQKQNEKDSMTIGGKAVGMSLIGAGAGALSAAMIGKMGVLGAALTPFGPVGGALVGLGLSIRAQKNNFKTWLFGKDEEDGTHKEGILGQFRNMLNVSLFGPVKTSLTNFVDESKLFLKYEVFDRIRFSLEPILGGLKGIVDNTKDKITGLFNTIGGAVKDNVLNPLVENVNKLIITPIRSAATGIAKVMWSTVKPIVALPFRLLEGITNFSKSMLAKGFGLLKRVTIDPIAKLVKNVIINPASKMFGLLFKGIKGTLNLFVKKPLELIGGAASYLGDKMRGVGKPLRETEDAGGRYETTEEERKARKKQKRIEYANLRQQKRERKLRDQNRIAIAKATGYQLTEDTEENRAIAKAAGARIKNTIAPEEKAGAKKEKDKNTAKMSESQLSTADPSTLTEEGRQSRLLQRILNVLSGKSPDGDKDDEEKKSKKNNSKTDSDDKSATDEHDETNTSEHKLQGAEKIRSDIHDAGGFFKYLKGKGSQAGTDIKDAYQDSYLNSKVNSLKGLLSRFNGKGYADGTEDADKGVSVVGEGGAELVDFSGGEKVFSNKKPLSVYIVGMANAVKGIFGKFKGKHKEEDADPDEEDIQSTTLAAANAGIENALSLVPALHRTGSTEDDQESLEDNMKNTVVAYSARKGLEDAIDRGYTAKERQEKIEEEKQKNAILAIRDNTEKQANEQSTFSNLWGSIFSKKGLITGALLMLAPVLLKFLKNFNIGDLLGNILDRLGVSLGDGARDLVEDIKFANDNRTRGDSKSITEKADEVIDRVGDAVQNPLTGGVLNEDGEWDHASGSVVASKLAAPRYLSEKVAKVVGKGSTRKGSKKLIKAGVKGVKKYGSKLFPSKAVGNAASNAASDVIEHVTGDVVDDVGNVIFREGGEKATRTASTTLALTTTKGIEETGTQLATRASTEGLETITTKSVTEIAENSNKGLIAKIIDAISGFFKSITEKLSSKFGKTFAGGKIATLISKFIEVVKKHFVKIADKIKNILGITGALATTGVGLLAAKGVFIALSAINGISGTARLFRVDSEHVDGTMTLISGLLGAFSGTTVGSIMDVCVELVASVTGIDIYNKLASVAYEMIMGQEKYENLRIGQEEFQQKYLEYQDEEFEKQYETLVASGNLDPNEVSLDDYKAGARDGTYKAKYDSFEDYNAEEHATIGHKIGKTVSSAWSGIKSGASWVGSKLVGSTDVSYSDQNGNVYKDNGDGTYQITSSEGSDLGFISADALPKNLTENRTEKSGLLTKPINAVKGAAKAISTGASNAWEGFKSGASKLGSSIATGASNAWSGFKTGASKIGSAISTGASNAWEGIKSGASNAWKTVGENWEKVKEALPVLAEKMKKGVSDFFTSDTTSVFLSGDGTYYDATGQHYTATGTKLDGDVISLTELSAGISNGLLERSDMVTRKSGISKIGEKIADTVSSAWSSLQTGWNKALDGISKGWNTFKEGAIETGSKIWNWTKERPTKVLNYFLGRTGTAYYAEDGSFYMMNGNTYDHYNASGDILDTGVDPEEVNAGIQSGQLREGEARVDSKFSQKISAMKETLSTGWNNVQDALSKGWNTFKEGVSKSKKAIMDWGSDKAAKLANYFLGRTGTAYYAEDGSFYMMNGNTYDHYNASGDLLDGGIDPNEINPAIQSGQLREGEARVDSKFSQKISAMKEKVTSAWDSAVDGLSKGWNTFKEGVSKGKKAVVDWGKNRLSDLKQFFIGSTEEHWIDEKGNYYVSNGNSFDYYNADGDLLKSECDADTITALIDSGMLKKEDVKKDSTLASAGKSVKKKITDLVDIRNEMTDGLVDAGKSVITSVIDVGKDFWSDVKEDGFFPAVGKFFSGKKEVAWFDSSGNYYILNGSTYDYYNANNDLIRSGISAEQVERLATAKMLTQGTIKKDSKAKTALKKIQDSVADAWDTAKNVVSSGWDKFKKWISGGSGNSDVDVLKDKKNYGEGPMFPGTSSAGGYGEVLNGSKYFSQKDSRWLNKRYGGGRGPETIGDTGCGPTAMSMIISEMEGKEVLPTELASFAEFTGSRDNTGTNWNFVNTAANTYGLKSSQYFSPSAETIRSMLKAGKPVLLSGVSLGSGKSAFTKSGHYVVAVGLDSSGNVIINDPRGKQYCGHYSLDDVASETNAAWSFDKGGGRGGFPVIGGGYGKKSSKKNTKSKSSTKIAKDEGYVDNGFTDTYETIYNNSFSSATSSSSADSSDDSYTDSSSTIVTEDTTSGSSSTDSNTSTSSGRRLIIVGDSRTHGMEIALGGSPVENDVYKYATNVYFICKDSQGYNWLSSTAGELIGKYANSSSIIVFWLGVNDPGNYASYASYVNKNASKWGGKVYYMSPTPCDPSSRASYNASVRSFNMQLKKALNNKIGWIDIYSQVEASLRSGKMKTTDGIHYDSATYKSIYTMLVQKSGFARTGGRGSGKNLTKIGKLLNRFGGGFGDSLNGFTYFSQNDSRWKNTDFSGEMNDGATIGDSGCGPTAMSMVASQLTGENITPDRMSNYAVETGTRDSTGTNWNFIDDASSAVGINSRRMYQPNENAISSELETGRPMILSGSSGDSGPYTKAGHYVVATGLDHNGNVIVNDPRGKGYSKKYKPSALVKNTKAAWSFGGGRGKNKKTTATTKKVTTVSSKIVQAREAVVGWMLSIIGRNTYTQSGARDQVGNGVTGNGYGDCSSTCCWAYKKGTGLTIGSYTGDMWNNQYGTIIQQYESSAQTYPDESTMLPGDLVFFADSSGSVAGGGSHVEMYIGSGQLAGHGSGTGPNIHSIKSYLDSRGTTKHWMYVVRYITDSTIGSITVEMPDKSNYKVKNNFTDGNGKSKNGANSGVVENVTGGSSSSSGLSSASGSNIFEKVGNYLSGVAEAAFNGIMTGDFSVPSSGSNDNSNSGSTVSGGTSLAGGSNAEKIWNYLDRKGINDYGKAGMMGNLEAESGLNFNNLENQIESTIGHTDESYTSAIDSGSIDKATFLNPIPGKQYGYGLAQWTSPGRKAGLYDLVKSRNVSIADPQAQMDWLYNELSTSYSSVLSGIKNASSVRSASDIVLTKFESPKDQGEGVRSLRASNGQKYYNQFAGGGKGVGTHVRRKSISNIKQSPSTTRNNIIRTDGGFGVTGSLMQTDDVYNNYVYNSQKTSYNKDNNYGELFTTMIEILGTIATNTGVTSSKLESLKNTATYVDSSKQIILTGNGTNAQSDLNKNGNRSINRTENPGAVTKETKTSRNQKIAEKIARGSY